MEVVHSPEVNPIVRQGFQLLPRCMALIAEAQVAVRRIEALLRRERPFRGRTVSDDGAVLLRGTFGWPGFEVSADLTFPPGSLVARACRIRFDETAGIGTSLKRCSPFDESSEQSHFLYCAQCQIVGILTHSWFLKLCS